MQCEAITKMTDQVAENITVLGSLVYNNQLCSRAPPQPPIGCLLTIKYYQVGIVPKATLQLGEQSLFR